MHCILRLTTWYILIEPSHKPCAIPTLLQLHRSKTKIPLMTIVLNNGQYGGYDRYLRHPETYIVTGDYANVAENLGAYAERIEAPDDVIPAIKRGVKAVDADRYVVLEMMTANFPKFPSFAGHQARH